MDHYVLLDIRGLMLRALHGGSDLDADTDSLTGKPVNTPGHCLDRLVAHTLLPILSNYRPRQIIAVWDGGNAYREAIYPEYKQHRKKLETSPELKSAIAGASGVMRDFFNHLGVTQVLVRGVEADDVIAWMVDRLPSTEVHTVDRDLIALHSAKCTVWCGGMPVSYMTDKDYVICPEHITLYKSLVGDTSDGYKGVPGFGPKKWQALFNEHGPEGLQVLIDWAKAGSLLPLQKIVAENPGVDPILELIAANGKDWLLSWKLAELHPELVNLKTYNAKGKEVFQTPVWNVRLPDRNKLRELLIQQGCDYLLENLTDYLPNAPFILDANNLTEDGLKEIREAFAVSPFVSIDWETSAPDHQPFIDAAKGRQYVDMLSSRLTGAGFTFGPRSEYTFYLTVNHRDSANVPAERVFDLIGSIPEHVPIVAHNLLFEDIIYKNHFNNHLPTAHCTKVMANHVDEQESAGLKDLTKRWFDYRQRTYQETVPKGMTMADLSVEEVFAYGADDPFVTAHLYEVLKLIMLLEGTWEFAKANEFPLLKLVADAYRQGMKVDFEFLKGLEQEDQAIVDTNMARLRALLKEHQTSEWLQQGVENLLEVEREIIDGEKAIALQDPLADEAAIKAKAAEAIANLRIDIEERVRYQDRQEVERELKLSYTPKQFSAWFEWLGLPPIEKFTKKAWEAWYAEAKDNVVDGTAAHVVELYRDDPKKFADIKGTSEVVQARVGFSLEAATVVKLFEADAKDRLPREKVFETVGSELSLSSPPQMRALLYGMLCLPLRMRNFSKTGKREELDLEGSPQANEDAIRGAIAFDTPEGDWRREALHCLLNAKKADTRIKNFYKPYPLWQHPLTGLVHPTLNSVGTETRRFSGASPNVMQISKRGEGVKVRRAVVPHDEHDLIVSIDWAGEELRIGAGLSLDMAMLSCYVDAKAVKSLSEHQKQILGSQRLQRLAGAECKDPHSVTAASIAEMSYEAFSKIYADEDHPEYKRLKAIRASAKAVNFGSQYGIGAAKLARQLLSSPKEAKDYLIAKKNAYAGYETWREDSIALLNRQGYLETLFGSRRHLFNRLLNADEGLKGALERSALNYLIQGLAADYLKKILSDLTRKDTFDKFNAAFIAPIHDELVFSCHSSVAAPLILEVHHVMTQGIPDLPVPLDAEVSLGPNFGDQTEIKGVPNEQKIAAAIGKALALNEAA